MSSLPSRIARNWLRRDPPAEDMGVKPEPFQRAYPPRKIALHEIVKEYHTAVGVRRVLDGISFDINAGEKIAVLGSRSAYTSAVI